MTQISAKHEAATPVRAIIFVLLTGLIFTVLDTCAKYLVLSGMSAPFVAWTRFAGHTLLATILLGGFRKATMFRTASPRMQVLRGLMLAGATIFNFAALMTLQLAQTAAIFFAVPVIVTALAGPLLGEWAGWRRWLAVLAGFCGVLVITRPGVGEFGVGHAFALCAMLSNCFYVILTRRMSAKESTESLLFYSALTPAVLMLPVVPLTATVPAGGMDLVLLVIIMVCGGLGHWFLIKAYALATTTALAPYPYLQMVWMIASGYLVFGQLPDSWTLAGAAIIVASGLYIVHREHSLRVQARNRPGSVPSERR